MFRIITLIIREVMLTEFFSVEKQQKLWKLTSPPRTLANKKMMSDPQIHIVIIQDTTCKWMQKSRKLSNYYLLVILHYPWYITELQKLLTISIIRTMNDCNIAVKKQPVQKELICQFSLIKLTLNCPYSDTRE